MTPSRQQPTTAYRPLVRRGLLGTFAGCAAGGLAVALLSVSPAGAAPDPCAASEIAKTVGSVATNTGFYLDKNPATNQALTTAAAQPGPQAAASLKTYFDANPQVSSDMQKLQQPLVSLSSRCKLPVTLPQALAVLGNLQNSQQAGQLPGANPAVPAPAAPAGGPLPGPARAAGTA
ncbi:hemophore [Mycobacterium sp. MYCO198283]|uniref:hemophore n=1 Tax=Mycobacterium sp. MYCO198283 TaxID=2883505 RepID=UPI001E32F34A|nr:hemophore [Mycobacterium sp. MYCO198283]MCG5431992.1 hemophore [Mycobacterium sp. MYCO198283]